MPLQTQFQRSGGELESLHWGWWHINCFEAAFAEENPEASRTALADLYEYTFVADHRFEDPDDGEILLIQPGDTFRWWRS